MLTVRHIALLATILGLLMQSPLPGYSQKVSPVALAVHVSGAAPIQIERLGINRSSGKAGARTWIVLWFRNENASVANEVRFVVRYDGLETIVVDKGTFSPGTLIAHEFAVPHSMQGHRYEPEVVVQSALYSNGTHFGTY